jgi:hypothetical protein
VVQWVNRYTVKKVIVFPIPGRELFPAMESLISDIPTGDRKNDNLFYSVPVQPTPPKDKTPLLLVDPATYAGVIIQC